MRHITCVSVALTTHCNLACPDCCCDIPNRVSGNPVSLEYLEAAAKHLRGVPRINITGGEPTTHPEFDVLSALFRSLFECATLTVETNGLLAARHVDALRHYDTVYVTHYTPGTFKDAPLAYRVDNTVQIQKLKEALGEKLYVKPYMYHQPRRVQRGTKPCGAAFSETVAFWNGKLFPCCLADGVPNAVGIALSPRWRTEILTVQLPCETCFFALP